MIRYELHRLQYLYNAALGLACMFSVLLYYLLTARRFLR